MPMIASGTLALKSESAFETLTVNQQMKYHAHIYFDAGTEIQAHAFQAAHTKEASRLGLWVSHLVDRKVGPHPQPMFEVHISSEHLKDYVTFLEKQNPGLSVLLHEDTGDDDKDHSDGARWFGKKLELDFGFFELIQRDASKKIHKD